MIGATSTSPGKVCLTWKIKMERRLILRCKTENFHYSISFYDPVGNETAFCTPKTCQPLMKMTSLYQNKTTNETFLTIPLGKDAEKFNGWWVCRYGRNNGKAKVEITLSTKFTFSGEEDTVTNLKPNYTVTNMKPNYKSCGMLTILSFVWLTVGFLTTQLFVSIITAVVYLRQGRRKFKQWIRSKFGCLGCLGQCAKVSVVVVQIAVPIIVIILMIVSYIRIRDEICYEPLSSEPLMMVIIPTIIGLLFGIVYFVLLQIKDDFEPNSNRNVPVANPNQGIPLMQIQN